MNENTECYERVLKKDIAICPNCKGAGLLKATNSSGTPVLRMGRPITETCPVCHGDGRVGHVVKELFYPMPNAPEMPKESGLKKLLNILK